MSLVSDFSLLSTRQEILREIEVSIRRQRVVKILAINAHNLALGLRNEQYRRLLSDSTVNICDGINVKRIIELTSSAEVECYPGPDLFDDLVFRKCLTSVGVHAFVGSTPEIRSGLQDRLGTQGYHYIPIPFVESVDDLDIRVIAQTINRAGADVVWIGLGTPKQEYFIDRVAPLLHKGAVIGVGAAFGFSSGLRAHHRAPQWMREHHLEWLHRLIHEPRRIGRRQVVSAMGLISAINRYG